jgi:sugar lactone lactonase YvrE
VRSHAKASSAGSTERRSSRSGSFVRGAFATRGSSGNADGSGAPSRRNLAVVSLAAALLALALLAPSALASKQLVSYFGTKTEARTLGGEFQAAHDVAANGTGAGPADAGDTYVVDGGNNGVQEGDNRIERFDASGHFISAWGANATHRDERQKLTVNATSGTYVLSFEGDPTQPIKYNAREGEVRAALAALPSVGGAENVKVLTGGGFIGEQTGEQTNVTYAVVFTGALSGTDIGQMTADTSLLQGTVEISTVEDGSGGGGSNFEICSVAASCGRAVPSGGNGTAAGNGALSAPESVAVDQDTGNVYVSDRDNRRIEEYDGVGNFIRAFGFDVVASGPDNTGTGYEICEEAAGDVCKAGVGGSGVGQYGNGRVNEGASVGFGIAVSPADGDASTGTVYLADSGNRRVDTFDLDGTSPASFGSSSQFGPEEPRSVAVDSRGIVYASDSHNNGDIQRYDSENADGGGIGFLEPIVTPGNEVQKVEFTGFEFGDSFKLACPDGEPTEELTYATGEAGKEVIHQGLEEACGAGSVSTSGNPPSTTVTFQGALGGVDQPPMTCTALSGSGSCSVSTVSDGHAGALRTSERSASSATVGLAVDPDSDGAGPDADVLYVLREIGQSVPAIVQQLGPTNAPGLSAAPTAADDTHGANIGPSSAFGFGLDDASGRLFISSYFDPDGSTGPIPQSEHVYVYNDTPPADPTASMKPIAVKAGRSATFEGSVDPKGGLVSCKFQYSTDGSNWTDVATPFPDCTYLDVNGGAQDVSQSVSGLVPSTEYFVRLQVTRPYVTNFTPVSSGSQGFTTDPAPPLVTDAAAKTLDDASVRISASIDPGHLPTSYVVEYGTSEALGSSTSPTDIGEGSEAVEVSQVVGGLAPATKYYFKLIATNQVGSTPSDVLTAGTFTTPTSTGSGEACPNDRFRTGPSAKLPDCRAYELATPVDKFGADVSGHEFGVEASRSGDGVIFYTLAGFPGGEGFEYFVSPYLSRFADGEWSTHGLLPPPSYGDQAVPTDWTLDLNLTFSYAFHSDNALRGTNYIMRDSSDGSLTLLTSQTPGESTEYLEPGGAFDGDSKIVFEADGAVPVTSGPAPDPTKVNTYLYDRDTGALTLIGLLPDSACESPPCIPVEGSKIPSAFGAYSQDGHAVSQSGNVYFDGTTNGKLYLRRDAADPSASTAYVAASHKTEGSGPNGVASNSPQPAKFQGATPDGSRALFTSSEELTNDANTGPEPVVSPPGPVAIGRANISDGSGAQPSFIPKRARWTAVDAGHVYWSNTAAGKIGRAEIDGGNPDPNFITGLQSPEGIAVDSGHVYWAEARDGEEGHGTIARAALDGSGNLVPGSVEREFISGANDPHGVAVSPESASPRYVYWANGVDPHIARAEINGAHPEQSFIPMLNPVNERPWGLAVDSTRIYWGEREETGSSCLISKTLEGASEEFSCPSGLVEVSGIAVDSNYLYWSDAAKGEIGRIAHEIEPSTPDSEFLTGVEGVFGVSVDASHLYWAAEPEEVIPPASPGNDLYRYDAESGELIDIAPDSTDPNGSQVVGVAGYSDDGDYVYFVANGDLDGGGPATDGHCAGTGGDSTGSCSLYLWRADGAGGCASAGGCVTFVAPQTNSVGLRDSANWTGRTEMKTSRVSADGHTLVFRSGLKLTGYENQGISEFYRYDAGSGQIDCLTCSPTGAPPAFRPALQVHDLDHTNSNHFTFEAATPFLSRNLSADGKRFFFQTAEKLVPTDVDGDQGCPVDDPTLGSGPACMDVYEWEAPGKGSCTTDSGAFSPANEGCIYLLSAGTGAYPSYLADASESGDTVFIFSRDQLVPADGDAQEDIYAVKVDGGLASQHAVRPAGCEGDACRGPSGQPSNAPGAGSAVFQGPGNPKSGVNATRCPKGKRQVRAKGKVRCVAKKHRKHRKGRHQKRQHNRANDNRRASR